ncbi:uncharacterized protein ACLA_078100 [Aspergillus clavatus NRRL 1]|uniref:NAD(P)-binding domain-containing protein n=1 Tax=Aspergillus clavatus (strain ATCC 1007 / CBS 513.65 / DSM 816 / NCTC 3887 / NRRL 1 / QM 1276 / 107) TaxID=344612 RepID=A1CLT3_ASPCL|nr:uncharacterized protein ACLA_078100 [Aspergillus clavatus NRRL 1]EAW09062.1 conserved hypothetical protein [Aspergillus clavatus NRRL 1]
MAVGYARDQPPGFVNRIERVAIVGAGGSVGRHLTEQLVLHGKHVVTAITRPGSNKTMPEGVRVARVDYTSDDDDDEKALVDVLRGQQVLLITMSNMAPPDTMLKLIRAAATAGVPYIEPNWYGHDAANNALCDESMISGKRDRVLAEIQRLGVSSYLLLVCNFWYEWSLGGGPNRFGFDFVHRTVTVFDEGTEPINTTTWPQCGRAVARLLSLKHLPDDENDRAPTLSRFRDGLVYVSSFRLTQREMFESVKRVTKTTDADWTILQASSRERYQKGREGRQLQDWSLYTRMLYSRMFFPNGGGDYESQRGLDNEALGLPVEDLDEATAEAIRMGQNNQVPFSH